MDNDHHYLRSFSSLYLTMVPHTVVNFFLILLHYRWPWHPLRSTSATSSTKLSSSSYMIFSSKSSIFALTSGTQVVLTVLHLFWRNLMETSVVFIVLYSVVTSWSEQKSLTKWHKYWIFIQHTRRSVNPLHSPLQNYHLRRQVKSCRMHYCKINSSESRSPLQYLPLLLSSVLHYQVSTLLVSPGFWNTDNDMSVEFFQNSINPLLWTYYFTLHVWIFLLYRICSSQKHFITSHQIFQLQYLSLMSISILSLHNYKCVPLIIK